MSRTSGSLSRRRKRKKSVASDASATPESPNPPARFGTRWLVEWGKSLAIAFVLWLVIRTLLIEGVYIPSGSMEDTFLIGDFLFVNKALYGAEIPVVHKRLPGFREPERGDIVMFDSPIEPGVKVVKRIIGLPGDTIAMERGAVQINGAVLDEPYSSSDPLRDREVPEMRLWQMSYLVWQDPSDYRPTLHNWGPIVVPRDSLFVMGDNRDESYDSRYWGFLGRRRITGHPWVIYYSYEKGGLRPLAFLTSIRWGRILSSPH